MAFVITTQSGFGGSMARSASSTPNCTFCIFCGFGTFLQIFVDLWPDRRLAPPNGTLCKCCTFLVIFADLWPDRLSAGFQQDLTIRGRRCGANPARGSEDPKVLRSMCARRVLLAWDSHVVCISGVPKVEGATFRGAEWIDLDKI